MYALTLSPAFLFFYAIQHPKDLPSISYILSPPIPATSVSATVTSYPRRTTKGL